MPRDRPSPKGDGARASSAPAASPPAGASARRVCTPEVGGSWSAESQRRRREKELGARARASAESDFASSAYMRSRQVSSAKRPCLAQLCRAVARERSASRPGSRSGTCPFAALHREGPMEKRKLGNSGLEIAPLMFGGNVFGWTADEATSFKLLDGFVDAGFNAIDTADVYSQWVAGPQGRRVRDHHRQLAEGARRARQGRHRHQGRHGDAGHRPGPAQGLHPARASRTRSKRLQTDYIDLYQSHTDDQARAARGDARRLSAS